MELKTKTTAVGLAATLLMAGGTGIDSGGSRVEIKHGITNAAVGVTGCLSTQSFRRIAMRFRRERFRLNFAPL
jgi:hypothetical protein